MAKTTKEKSSDRHATPYVLAGILLAFVTIINMIQVGYLYRDITNINMKTSRTMNSLNRVSGELSAVNEDILRLMGNVGDNSVTGQDIGIHMGNMFASMGAFEAIGEMPEAAQKRYNYAKTMIQAYSTALDKMSEAQAAGLQAAAQAAAQGGSAQGGPPAGAGAQGGPPAGEGVTAVRMSQRNASGLRAMYTQNVYPLQVTSSEMLVAVINITSIDAQRQQNQAAKVFYVIDALMFAIMTLGEIAIWFIARYAIRSRLEIEEKEKNLAEVDARLKNTRQKASDMAVTNILTGMKNRDALDNDLTDRLENDRFNIAVFDLDNFRSINDTYGYDFGDEYLAAIAEKLKEEFSDIAEIYNITGNEFCFVFNRDVTESQAMRYIQDIQNVMSAPYNVLNLTVQLPVSGAVYHYLAGDCLNVNSLLVKLDTTMRMAKMNGGNMVNTVVNM